MRTISNDYLNELQVSDGMYVWFNKTFDAICNLDNAEDIAKFVGNEDILVWYMGVTNDMEALDILLKYIVSHSYKTETDIYFVVGSLKHAISYKRRSNIYHIITYTTQPQDTMLRYKSAYHLYKYIDLLIIKGDISILDIIVYQCFECNTDYYSNLHYKMLDTDTFFNAEYIIEKAQGHTCEDIVLSMLQAMAKYFKLPINTQAFTLALKYRWYDIYYYMLGNITPEHLYITAGCIENDYLHYKNVMPEYLINTVKAVIDDANKNNK